MTMPQIVIVGAGHAGVQAASALRAKGYAGHLVLLDQQAALPYERPPLSKDVLVKPVNAPPLRKESFYADRGITLERDARVESIDRTTNTVHLADGRALGYSELILATGSTPRALPIPGAELDGVCALRTEQDALFIRKMWQPGSNLVVIGAGYVGLEAAAAAAACGVNVTVIERERRVLARVASAEVSAYMQLLHESHGVRFILEQGVRAIEGTGHVKRVLTSQNEPIEADMVIVGIGVDAADQLARAAGLDCDNGILVDEYCRTSDPRIYAIGDVTRFHHTVLGAKVRLECIANAMAQAERVAESLLGLDLTLYEAPWFWSVQYNTRLQSVGQWKDSDETVLRGDMSLNRFSILHLRDSRLVAIESVGMSSDFVAARKLIRMGATLQRNSLSDPSVALTSCAISSLVLT